MAQDRYEATVENIIFQSQDKGFAVFTASATATGTFTATYKGPAPYVGEVVSLLGDWREHPRFGRQLQVTSCQAVQPSDLAGLERFLASGAFKGIGPSMAAKITAHFGEQTFSVLEESPERIQEVTGIGKKKAQLFAETYGQMHDTKELLLFLETHGLSSNYAPKLVAAYGASAITRITHNPYCLVQDISGIGFRTADRVAQALGWESSSSERIKSGLSYALTQTAAQGHTCVPEEYLLKMTGELLQLDALTVGEVFNQLLRDDYLRTEMLGGTRLVYPEYLYQAEVSVAHRLLALRDHVNNLWRVDYGQVMDDWQAKEGISLAPEQKEAVGASVKQGIFVLTGGPGTGKTTVVKGIISVLAQAGCKVLLAAPTGRAAKRLSEASGREAVTVHRLLEYTPAGDTPYWGRNEDNPLEADALIIDEASMLDISLTHYLLRAVPLGCRLILVGDVDQLPSVGPGSVLQDIIRSKAMPIVRLENIFRQAQLSSIVVNAHRINRGQMPELAGEGEFIFVPKESEEEAASYVVEAYKRLLADSTWDKVQVLSPMYRNPCGVENLNKKLQAALNPPAENKAEVKRGETVFRLGDKVMQLRNNYEKDVYNGDVGQITKITGARVEVAFPDKNLVPFVSYEGLELDELCLAYAMSVHKSQGSEYATVILPLVPSHYILLQRNLFYTGITRAKSQVILVGSKKAIAMAVQNDRTRKRYSLLAERLREDESIL